MTKLNLDNAYRITLETTQGKPFVQYIEASDIDKANRKARLTFEAGFYKFKDGFEAQKACRHTKLNGRLRFGFKGGWNTLDCTGMTIFEALEKAQYCFGGKEEITQIVPPIN